MRLLALALSAETMEPSSLNRLSGYVLPWCARTRSLLGSPTVQAETAEDGSRMAVALRRVGESRTVGVDVYETPHAMTPDPMLVAQFEADERSLAYGFPGPFRGYDRIVVCTSMLAMLAGASAVTTGTYLVAPRSLSDLPEIADYIAAHAEHRTEIVLLLAPGSVGTAEVLGWRLAFRRHRRTWRELAA